MTERTKLTEDEVIEPAVPPLELSEADDLATFDITDVDALLNDKDTIIKTTDADDVEQRQQTP
jgi:hypothetical protein